MSGDKRERHFMSTHQASREVDDCFFLGHSRLGLDILPIRPVETVSTLRQRASKARSIRTHSAFFENLITLGLLNHVASSCGSRSNTSSMTLGAPPTPGRDVAGSFSCLRSCMR